MPDPADHVILDGTTLLVDGVQAGKSVSEFTSGLKIGRATQDDRQHAFYTVFDDFSGGFGHRQLDIREALGTHWDNAGGADVRRARHVTLPPARFVIPASENPTQAILSSEILDGAALAVPTDDPDDQDAYFYGAGDKVYRMIEDRNILTHLQSFLFSGGAGIVTGGTINEPEKMTRLFLHRGPLNVRRLYLVTTNSNPAGSSSAIFYTEDPGVASPTWVEGVRAAWDAMSVPFGARGANVVVAQAITFEFMFATDPKEGATDWNIDDADAAINEPLWLPSHICRFIGVAVSPTNPVPALYFIDFGDGQLYYLDYHINKAFPIGVGDYHYLANGVIWEGHVAITDGWDVWLYSPGGGGTETVRRIGLFGKDGVPESLHEGRYRISGLVDGGRYLYAIAERTALGKDGTTSTLGFMVFVYNGAGWSVFIDAIEAAASSTTSAVNPIAAIVDRYPMGVVAAQNIQKETTRAFNILCQAHPDNSFLIQLHSFSLPKIGTIPIDNIDEFHGDGAFDHSFRTGWFDGGFADLEGALYYAKITLQSNGGTGSVRVSYRLDDDETADFTLLGVATDLGNNEFQFDAANKAGIQWRTVQFEIEPQRAPTSSLTAGIDDAVTSIPVGNLALFAARGLIQIESEFIDYTARSASSGAGNLTGGTRGARGSTAASHADAVNVDSLNRTPELRSITIVYSKKSVLRKTWVFAVDVDKMVEQKTLVDTTGNGTPDTEATHQNVIDYLEALWNKQPLVQLTVPEAEPGANNLRVQIADFVIVQDDNRETSTDRSRINVTVIEPVKAS